MAYVSEQTLFRMRRVSRSAIDLPNLFGDFENGRYHAIPAVIVNRRLRISNFLPNLSGYPAKGAKQMELVAEQRGEMIVVSALGDRIDAAGASVQRPDAGTHNRHPPAWCWTCRGWHFWTAAVWVRWLR